LCIKKIKKKSRSATKTQFYLTRVTGEQRDIFRMEAKRPRENEEEDQEVNVIDDGNDEELKRPTKQTARMSTGGIAVDTLGQPVVVVVPETVNDQPPSALRRTVKIRQVGTEGHVLDDNGQVAHVIKDFVEDPEDDEEEEDPCDFCNKYNLISARPNTSKCAFSIAHDGTVGYYIPRDVSERHCSASCEMEKKFDPEHTCVNRESCLLRSDRSEVLLAVRKHDDKVCGKIEYDIRDAFDAKGNKQHSHAHIRWILTWPHDEHIGTGLLQHLENHLSAEYMNIECMTAVAVLSTEERDETVRRRFGFWLRRGFKIDSYVIDKEKMECRFTLRKQTEHYSSEIEKK
jgi:hypothetical protein